MIINNISRIAKTFIWNLQTKEEYYHMNIKERVRQLKIDIPAVFIALKRKDTPIMAKVFAGITVVYALSPIDFIPDFIPVLGYLDDIILLPGLIAITIRLIPAELFAECRIQSEGLWDGDKPRKWYYALPIVIIWLLIIFLIVRIIWF